MLIKVRRNGDVVFQFNNHLDGSTARSVKMYLDYAIDLGEKRVLLDFSRVRNFEYSDMAVLIDSLLHHKKGRDIEIGLQGLSGESGLGSR